MSGARDPWVPWRTNAERLAGMTRDRPSRERHMELAKRRAELAAVHASLVFVESELLVDQVKRELDRSRRCRQQLVTARQRQDRLDRAICPTGWRS